MDALIKFGNLCEKIMMVIAVVLLSFIPIAIGLQVVFRSLNFSLNWSEESARFAYVAVTFMGSVMAIKHGKHITITFLFDKLSRLTRRTLGVIIHLFMAAFMVFCSYGSTLIMEASRGVRSNSMQWFHLNYLYGFVFICCCAMVIVCLIRALEFALDKVEMAENVTGGAI